MNYFKESIHFCNFFIKNTSGKQKTLKTHTKKSDLVGKGFNIAQHNAVVALKTTTVFVNSVSYGLYIYLLWTYMKLIVIILSSTATVMSRQWLGFSSSNNLDT